MYGVKTNVLPITESDERLIIILFQGETCNSMSVDDMLNGYEHLNL